MIYRTYGNTGKRVSLLGFGAMRFPQNLLHDQEGIEKCARLVMLAAQMGVNYFDTAPLYCDGKSEEILGLAFQELKKQHLDFFVSTKTRVIKDPTADSVRRRIESSLKKLNLDRITFYHMWSILNLEEYYKIISPGGPLHGALKAKDEGLIEHICFSTHCNGEEIETIIKDGFFEGVTLGYNAINFRFRERGLLAATEANIGIATMNPLGGGIIPKNPDIFSFLKKNNTQNIASAALQFNAAHPGISVVLSGIANEQNLYENVKALSQETVFSEEFRLSIYNNLKNYFDRLCTGCGYCNVCPQNIEIAKLMDSYNHYLLDNNSIENFRYHMMNDWNYPPEEIFHCIQCKRCQQQCTQHLPIVERITEINKWNDASLKSAVSKFADALGSAKRIGIYAAGPYAENKLKLYNEIYGRPDVQLFFFDSDPYKWGKPFFYEDTLIYPPQDIETYRIEKILIASQAFYKEIYESLRHLEEKGITLIGI